MTLCFENYEDLETILPLLPSIDLHQNKRIEMAIESDGHYITFIQARYVASMDEIHIERMRRNVPTDDFI